ncbi:ATP-dependent DNA helicase PIF1 [Portunus trituberculatus]|uniref:ATP-dependent DNA helicase PIF1 n=1 Tax=Portunus trituberculatus TaxID=210409 RepID=A0A5B7K1V6_PORTR|nr:ATP-dependent DNA helicase PIF1 [Portunus trituberculatus]
MVRFLCGVTTEIKYEKWSVTLTAGYHITRKQLPLQLAWAFSIHKSQVGTAQHRSPNHDLRYSMA